MFASAPPRRSFLGRAAGLAAAALLTPGIARAATEPPFTTASQHPARPLPPDACDCHMHIYDGRFPLARAWLAAAPDQLVWGSDWPHPTEEHKPHDAALLDLLTDWTDGETALRDRALVANPARLYRF